MHQQDLKGLIAFCDEHPSTKPYVVSQDLMPRTSVVNDQTHVHIMPWRNFLEKLWADMIV